MKKKRTIITLAACGLIVAMSIMGTIAYLTDQTSATNSFTFGDVKVDTLEPDWDTTDEDGNGVPDVAEFVVPNQQIPKSVQAENVGINDAIVFIKITVPLETVTRVSDNGQAELRVNLPDGTLGSLIRDTKLQEVFYFQMKGDSINTENNHFDENWVNLPEEEIGYEGAGGPTEYLDLTNTKVYEGKVRTYVFGYNKRIAEGEKTTTLFDKVQIKNVIENEVTPGAVKNIEVETYSIQADNIVNADGAIDTTGTLSHDTLKEIYDIYVTQNPDYNDRPAAAGSVETAADEQTTEATPAE